MPLIIIFFVIPLVELAIFGMVSESIGVWTTLLFALLTAIIGGNLVRHQGLQTIMSMRQSMDRGGIPVTEIFDGFCLVAAGALLITPGFFTDTIGFLLLIPQVRNILRHYIKNHTKWAVDVTSGPTSGHYDSTIIEGEYETVEDEKIDRR